MAEQIEGIVLLSMAKLREAATSVDIELAGSPSRKRTFTMVRPAFLGIRIEPPTRHADDAPAGSTAEDRRKELPEHSPGLR